MENNPIFWDRKIGQKEARRILADEANPRFTEIAALLLSRTNQPKTVFAGYLDKVKFCRNWRRIKRQMRLNKWNDQRIIFWDEVYRVVLQDVDKNQLKSINKREVSVDTELKEIFDGIREIRRSRGLTQVDLAEKTGLSQQTISFVEQGYINISLKTLKKIADALGLRMSLTDKS